MSDKPLINYSKFYLPNGLKCILYKRPEIHSVTISVQVNVGSLDEDEKNNGISHLLEHLPFDGTEKFKTWSDVDRFNNNISGSGNAYTTINHTKYYGTFPYQYLEQALDYYSQLVLHPLFKSEDVKKERDIVLDEMKRNDDTVEAKIYDNIRLNRFENSNTPFSYQVIGTQENVSSFDEAEILDHYNKHYTPENMEIFIIGNFDEDNLKKLLEKYFYVSIKNKNYSKKSEKKYLKEFPEYSKFNIKALQKADVDQYYLTLTFPSFEKAEKGIHERLGVPFLERTMASPQYQQSILWGRLREELGLVYGINAYQYDLYKRSMFIVETSFNPEHLETILKESFDGINKIRKNEITDEIFKTRQKRLIDTQLMTLDHPESVMNWIEEQEEEIEFHGKGLSIEEFIEKITEYKFEEVINISNEIIDWNNLNIGIVSKDDSSEVEEKVKKLWESITSSK